MPHARRLPATMTRGGALLSAALLLAAAAPAAHAQGKLTYPATPKGSVVDTYTVRF